MCDQACPARLPISAMTVVRSPECTGCLDCVAVCPVSDTLELRTVGRRKVPPLAVAAAVLGLFLGGYVGARATGNWANQIPDQDYVEHIRNMESGRYSHPGG